MKRKEQLKENIEKYTISGLWITMCGYIVLLFVKEFLTQHYLISFSIDLLVAIICFYVTVHNFIHQYQCLKDLKTTFLPFYMEVVGIIFALFITLMTLKSPFDISFLILVIACITSKRILEKEMKKFL